MSDMDGNKNAAQGISGGSGMYACYCSNSGCAAAGKCLGAAGLMGHQSASLVYFDRVLDNALTADDVRSGRYDRDSFGRIHPEIRYAIALQVLRSIRDEQKGANSVVKALAAATLDVLK